MKRGRPKKPGASKVYSYKLRTLDPKQVKRWKRAAEKDRRSLNNWICLALDKEASRSEESTNGE